MHRPHPKRALDSLRWQNLTGRFPEARDCLASFLAYECAEILAGAKPANLINLVDRSHPCGRNFYRLWQEFGAGLIKRSGLVGRILVDRGDSLLLLVYSPTLLEALLAKPAVQAMLRRAGYDRREDLAAVLEQLATRCAQVRDFPHEIGIVLGYPLKDVAAFMGWVALPFVIQGAWKIYGQAEESLRLAARHRRCRTRMVRRLATCSTPVDCLHVRGRGREQPFSHVS